MLSDNGLFMLYWEKVLNLGSWTRAQLNLGHSTLQLVSQIISISRGGAKVEDICERYFVKESDFLKFCISADVNGGC